MLNSPFRDGALAGLMHGLAETNPALAVDYATKRLPPEFHREAAIHISGSLIYQLGNEGTQAWFDGIPSDTAPGFQKEAARVLLESLSRSQPGSVEKFALERLDQTWVARPDEQKFTVQMIMRNRGNPWDYVASVADKYPNAEAPLGLAIQAARYQPDPQAARAWLDAHPDHPAADQVVAGMAQALLYGGAPEQKAEAEKLLSGLKDQSLRDHIVVPGG